MAMLENAYRFSLGVFAGGEFCFSRTQIRPVVRSNMFSVLSQHVRVKNKRWGRLTLVLLVTLW